MSSGMYGFPCLPTVVSAVITQILVPMSSCTASGSNSTWAFGLPTTGPGSGKTKPNVWATNLGGSYNNNDDSIITSPAIDLSTFYGYWVCVNWWQWLQTEGNYDWAYVDISPDGGANWLGVYGGASGNVDLSWANHIVLIPLSYCTTIFKIRFRFHSDGSATFLGWYIDQFVPITRLFSN